MTLMGNDGLARCAWASSAPEYIAYHDEEWGRPVSDERRVYEKLCLEGFQAGLAWITILRKREAFRKAFASFDPGVVAEFDDKDVERLLGDAGIVRHRGKIQAAITNARATIRLRSEGTSLPAMVWRYEPRGQRGGWLDAGVEGAVEGAPCAWVRLRRADHIVRRHAGAGRGQ